VDKEKAFEQFVNDYQQRFLEMISKYEPKVVGIVSLVSAPEGCLDEGGQEGLWTELHHPGWRLLREGRSQHH
jgi:hypothetical protein